MFLPFGIIISVQITSAQLRIHLDRSGKGFDCNNLLTYQALTLGLWVQWPGGPVDLKTYWPPKNLLARGASRFENLLAPQKTYWPPKKLTGPYLKTKLARRKTICINLQFAHRPIIQLFRSHPRNIFQI